MKAGKVADDYRQTKGLGPVPARLAKPANPHRPEPFPKHVMCADGVSRVAQDAEEEEALLKSQPHAKPEAAHE